MGEQLTGIMSKILKGELSEELKGNTVNIIVNDIKNYINEDPEIFNFMKDEKNITKWAESMYDSLVEDYNENFEELLDEAISSQDGFTIDAQALDEPYMVRFYWGPDHDQCVYIRTSAPKWVISYEFKLLRKLISSEDEIITNLAKSLNEKGYMFDLVNMVGFDIE